MHPVNADQKDVTNGIPLIGTLTVVSRGRGRVSQRQKSRKESRKEFPRHLEFPSG
jgi:hypothetical protein